MRYKDWKNEVVAHHDAAKQLESGTERRYLVSERDGEKMYLYVHAYCWVGGGSAVTYTLSTGRGFNHDHDPLSELTSEDMYKIAVLKKQVEDWVSGDRDSMPDDTKLP